MAAYDLIKKLLDEKSEKAIYTTINWMYRRCPIGDPYHNPTRAGAELTYEEALTICSLIDRLNTDSIIFPAIDKLCDSVQGKSKRKLTEQHKKDIASKLEEIVSSKLPDKKILCMTDLKLAH